MPQMTTIAIADGKGTPIVHTFNRGNMTGSIQKMTNRVAATLLGREQISLEVTPPKSPSSAHRVRIGLGVPVEATVSGVTTVDHTSSVEVVFNLAQKSSDQERLDLITLTKNLLLNADIITIVRYLESAD